jgi:hypothetical protein
MLFRDIIKQAAEHGLTNGNVFIFINGKLTNINGMSAKTIPGENSILITDGSDGLTDTLESTTEMFKKNPENLKEYFSTWFDIITEEQAKDMFEKGIKDFFVLSLDRTDRSADGFDSWDEIKTAYPDDTLFGTERKN